MVINLNLLAVVAAIALLIVVYMFNLKSGVRGLLYLLCGSAVIVAAYLYTARMFALLGIVIAAILLCGVLACIAGLAHAHRRKAHYYVPLERRGKDGKATTTRRRVA